MITTANPFTVAGLSKAEEAKVSAMLQSIGTTPADFLVKLLRMMARTGVVPLLVDPSEKTDSIREVLAPVFDEQSEKEKLIQRMEARRGYKLPRFASREEALASADRAYQEAKNNPQSVDDMGEEEFMKLVDEAREEVWQEQQKEKLLAFASN